MDRSRFLLLLLVFVSPSVADLQSNGFMEQRSVKVEPQPCPSDVQAVLRDLTAKLASLQTKTQCLEKENQEQAAKLMKYEDEIKTLQILDREQAAKLIKHNEDIQTLQILDKALAAEINNINTRTNATENQVDSLRRDRDVGRVAFSASLWETGSGYVGPFNVDTTLVLRHVISNFGNAYNSDTGIFTAPVRGVYHLEFSMYTLSPNWFNVKLVKNREPITTTVEGGSGTNSHGANRATLLLEPGDVVFLRLHNNHRIWDDQDHLCTFSGRLMFLM